MLTEKIIDRTLIFIVGLSIALTALKLGGVLAMSWAIVLAPVVIPFGLLFFIAIIGYVYTQMKYEWPVHEEMDKRRNSK